MTERERRQLLRQRPDITDWRAVLLGPENPIDVAVRGFPARGVESYGARRRG